jgi:hypothetical protein
MLYAEVFVIALQILCGKCDLSGKGAEKSELPSRSVQSVSASISCLAREAATFPEVCPPKGGARTQATEATAMALKKAFTRSRV